VRLAHGSARFDVAKKPTRRFSVDLGKVEVVVTGTQFRVLRKASAAGERVRVEVLEGSVEVHRADGGLVSLHRGEHWSTLVSHDQDISRAAISHDEGAVSGDERGRDDVEAREQNEDGGEFEGAEADEQDRREVDTEEADVELAEVGESDLSENDEADEDQSRGSARARERERSHSRRRRARAEARAEANDAGELFDHANLARRWLPSSWVASAWTRCATCAGRCKPWNVH
jgi:hypothetical protein